MKKKIYIGICLLALVLVGAANGDIIQTLKNALRDYNADYPSEKVYLQTDKTYYKPLESIWYKGFLSNGTDNKPSQASDIIYVELQDPWGNVVERHEQNVMLGTFNGVFTLSDKMAGGIYKIVGYTTWLKNWGQDYFFSKDITVQKVITPRLLLKLDFEKRAYGAGDEVVANLKVTDLNNVKTTGSQIKATVRIAGKDYKTINGETSGGESVIRFPLPKDLNTADGILQIVVKDKGVEESIPRSIPIVINKVSIRFFPEGGDLVSGVENKVAFEALNEFGKGADVSGDLVDDKGQVITSFNSFHLGMGAFSFTPEKDRTYSVRISAPAGNEDLNRLPQAKDNGYTLSLSEKRKGITTWKIYSPKDNNDAYFIAHTQGVIHYTNRLSLKKGINSIEVNTSGFPMGIAVFTLLNGKIEVAERLVFLNAGKKMNIELQTDKEHYEPKEKVSLSIKTTDDMGNPLSANIGLSVVDEQILTMADDKQDNLLTYMLLSSELKGEIQEPSFYFDPNEPKANEAIDYLLLTHGWRRFKWADLLSPSKIEINNMAERFSSIYGYMLNKNGQPTSGSVYLIELGGKKRIAKLNTTKEGHFVFHNVDISEGICVSAKLPDQIYLIGGVPMIERPDEEIADTEEGGVLDLSEKSPDVSESKPVAGREFPYTKTESFAVSESNLEEVMVVGYGRQNRQLITTSVMYVDRYNIGSVADDLMTALSGNVAGISIGQKTVDQPTSSQIHIRGTSSLISAEPLVIINGIPVEGSAAYALSLVNPGDIDNINVVKSVNGSAIYGSRASNGVILISTKRKQFKQKYSPAKANYSTAYVFRRQFYKAPVFTQDKDNPSQENTTVYWNGDIHTDAEGKASIEFVNNKNSSTFRITAEGISPSHGLLATATKRIVTQKPFSIDAKIPPFAGCGDIIKIPVMLKNLTDKPMKVNLSVTSDKPEDVVVHNYDNNIEVPANSTQTVFAGMSVEKPVQGINIRIVANADGYKDEIGRMLTVREVNFPYQYGFSGRAFSDKVEFDLPDYVKGTLYAEAVAEVEITNQLFDGAESIFRQPYGCFEQVLSSAFPNVFALQLLKATGKTDEAVLNKAMMYLENGYSKLANYEVKKTGGFEWYGGSPAHEMLTAYGLVHFHELQKVYGKVNQQMVDRAMNFLLSRKDGKGGFSQNRGKYGFSAAPRNVNNAYIVYALNEIGSGELIGLEYQSALQEAMDSKDIYRMALLANAAYQSKDIISYKKLVADFKEIISKEDDLSKLKIQATIVYSYGDAGIREAIAYWLLALYKDNTSFDIALIEKCLDYIAKGKRGGYFGNTQATSVCLQALSKYAMYIGAGSVKGSFSLKVNDNEPEGIVIKDYISRNIKPAIAFADKLKQGKNTIWVDFKERDMLAPYAVNISWYSALPATSPLCPLQLTTRIEATDIKVNETVRLSVRLKNTDESTGKPMSIAVIGIPGGMSLQPWQLKELQEKEVFDFYEIINDNLVVYYRELGPGEEKVINLDLKAEIPGTYTAMASSAYLYYMDEHKYWISGIKVKINE
ncbi:alpha-2-macroglobulin family protein [Dysgonomonas sp. 511]|uniref:TonB-dependent receptor plug domain-containing protein n=1 Tax=Dysgonomonas sp. 511 TaxID=2302930 RepID=UPI0013D750C7|nr:alpha-2-macroglobulin family protein [Dysgonomonas sp. 511]NDV77659.1 hypothetical protein [Dysgonomonas sp. 511]